MVCRYLGIDIKVTVPPGMGAASPESAAKHHLSAIVVTVNFAAGPGFHNIDIKLRYRSAIQCILKYLFLVMELGSVMNGVIDFQSAFCNPAP